ncbi:winged helix-turn-helix transcriptional regulator [Streptomyces sp. NA04227]|uniref:MarR family winged helix-turn-helix transcriptional regulator n=1 Tax=Streptomyces sp. NA04227 TaxID=2742136 RepID=UPI00159104FE|nr:MarR family winged helix-turn-helix transcriptional regulator [Streptomyces sp. NA04227]QKW09128.1 winged helix-turn-helix transcriptional regulator [Streptomyces sp. NA04227]
MEYSHSDRELVQQPIGYWGWAAQKSVVTYIRAGLAEYGFTQPRWWVLAQVARSEAPRTREDMASLLKGYLDAGATAIHEEVDALIATQLIMEEADGRLILTPEGNELFGKLAARQREMRTQIHHDISDEEYLTTLKVLQRMIHNTDGKAWHH